jgi:hypothetical protein
MICQNINLSKINQFLAFAANTTKSQGKSLFLLKERAILRDVSNERLCIVVKNSSGVDKFYIVLLANWICKLTVTLNYRALSFSCFVYMGQERGLSSWVFTVFVKKLMKKKKLVGRGVLCKVREYKFYKVQLHSLLR